MRERFVSRIAGMLIILTGVTSVAFGLWVEVSEVEIWGESQLSSLGHFIRSLDVRASQEAISSEETALSDLFFGVFLVSWIVLLALAFSMRAALKARKRKNS